MENSIATFTKWSDWIKDSLSLQTEDLFLRAKNENGWFTTESINLAFDGVYQFLDGTNLEKWVSTYDIRATGSPQNVGLVLAGNIPLVGFHDVLCVLMAGHNAVIKCSSDDSVLLKYITSGLNIIDNDMASRIQFVEKLSDFDAVIATGSNNTSRYFEYYFKHVPNIIRKNRTSIAILTGDETDEELAGLAFDILAYYGLGCRNVSKIFLPEEYNIEELIPKLESQSDVINHHKYANNYDYNKSIYLINDDPFLDNGFLMFKQSPELHAPISVLFHENYQDINQLSESLKSVNESIQCIVGKKRNELITTVFGSTQIPQLWDYADNVDTMEFLLKL